MASDGRSLQDKVEAYRNTNPQNSTERSQIMSSIMSELKTMPLKDRQQVLDQMREDTIAVNGQEPRIDSVYAVMMQIHCEMIADSWMGTMEDHLWKQINGNRGSTYEDVNKLIEDSLNGMLQKDPVQYKMFVNAINNRVVDPLNNGVEKSAKVMNIENEALKQLKTVVNNFDMQRNQKNQDDPEPEME